MTSLAFILGVMPLAFSSGAGAGARHSAGTGVMGGMLAATFLAVFFIPWFFKLIVDYASRDEMATILDRTTKGVNPHAEKVMDGPQIRQWQDLVRKVLVAPPVQDYAIRLELATHPQGEFAAGPTNKFLRFGASPRAAQALVLAAKVRALLEERVNVSFEDIQAAALPALRHRLIPNFEAEAEGITTDHIIAQILRDVPVTAEAVNA